jgi:DNA-binding LacI/PurR family transcriptional regulator
VQKLLECAKGVRPDPLHEYLPIELIVRESTAPPTPAARVPAQSP